MGQCKNCNENVGDLNGYKKHLKENPKCLAYARKLMGQTSGTGMGNLRDLNKEFEFK